MLRSDQINELAAALCKAQGKFPILQKRSKAYNWMYADLAEILECVQPILEANELSISSEIDWDKPTLTMYLFHSSGQHIGCSIKLHYKAQEKTNEMQAMGSSITYARRYCICCLLNLAADKETDDDGHRSAPKGEVKEQEKPKPVSSAKDPEETFTSMTEAQCAELDDLLAEDGSGEWVITEVTKKKGVRTIYEIDSAYFENDLKKWLLNRKKIKAAKK